MALMRTDEGGTIRVLMVEDMELEAELAAAQLHANGIRHEALRVETEAELRAALREFRPSIILSDFALPQFDGLRALAVARECAPEVPFVFVSGTIGEERAIEALRRGAVDYVLKTNLARLGPAVKRAVEEAAANTVRRRQAQQIARLTGVLRMLSGINGAVVRIRDRGSLLQEACRLAVTVGGYATAIVTLHRVKKGTRELVAWDGTDEGAAQALAAVIERRAAQERLSNRAEGGVPPELIFSESEYRGSQPPQEAAGPPAEPGTPLDRPMIALPLKVDRTVIGVLAVCSRQRGIAGEEEMRLLREVAANLSFALQYLQQGNQVRLLSYFDVLTGLAKRPLFCQRLGQYLGPASAGRQLAVAVVDVQDLSAVNDMLGRHTGDLMLQLLADRLKTRFGSTDLLGHFGGGTFALIQPSDSEHSRPDTLTGLIDALFAEPFDLEQRSVPVAARTGLAIWPGDGHDPGVLVQRAEAALRTARAGGDRWRHYSAEQHTAALARVSLERRLRVALEHRQFELHYQPKVNIRSGSIEGAEALIRWHDPEQGLVPPAQFLQVLEATGLIADVGLWVVEQAAADCRSWREAGLPPLRVAVNVSPLQLNRMGFAEQFLERALPWASPEFGLDVEITEGALLDESAAVFDQLRMLRAAGINVAIDDFGTGFSSLARLDRLPIDTLKIDRSFISRLAAGGRGRKLVSVIIAIARAFRMTVIAEGVETQEQLQTLGQLGCDQSQGYLHSRPVPGAAFAQLLRKNAGEAGAAGVAPVGGARRRATH